MSERHGITADLAPLAFPVELLDPLPGNPRTGDVEAVADSYREFGQRKPLVGVRRGERGVVTSGNHQLAAARDLLGWTHVAVVWTDDDDTRAAAFALADNRVGELGDPETGERYDGGLLAQMMTEVRNSDAGLFEATSWSPDDLAELLEAEPKAKAPASGPEKLRDYTEAYVFIAFPLEMAPEVTEALAVLKQYPDIVIETTAR